MGRSRLWRPKKNRKAKTMRRIWELRQNYKLRNIFEDLEMQSEDELSETTTSQPTLQHESKENDIIEIDHSAIPNWCTKTYSRMFRNTSAPVQSCHPSGTISSDEYDVSRLWRPKKNRKAKTMRRIWELRQNYKLRNIFEDLEMQSEDELSETTTSQPTLQHESKENDIIEIDHSAIPNWCTKTYSRMFRNTSAPVQSCHPSGTISSDEYDV
ncbi:hypothetical protein FQR65_LT18971 [Abscondita terminalis]|nr:hypothetical protein FQR65_LT18971 [Abscondita terminalis]